MTTLKNFQDVELEVKKTNLEVERLLTDVRLILDRINHITGISGSFSASPSLATDHGILSGLGDDDHPHYLLASGTRELTGNWDAGPFSITALTLISDVATGTAPLTVTSTTVVPNLNVDQVDGFHLDQDVTSGSSPTFDGANFTGIDISDATNLAGGSGVTLNDDTLDLEINSLAVGAIAAGDFVPFWDITVTADNKKITFANLEGTIDHGNIAGTGDDDHSQYALLAGRATGQTLIGGTASGEDLTLQSTAHATKGSILFGNSAYDEVNNRLGVGTSSPETRFHARQFIALGASLGNSQLAQSLEMETGNNVFERTWLYRDAAGANWMTTRVHNGISVDSSYGTPGTNTRTWWERDPYNDIQSWGTGGSAYVTINAGNTGFGIIVPDGKVHIHTATAGSVTAVGSANELVLENSGDCGLSILAPNTSTSAVVFGSPSDNSGAWVSWNFNSKLFIIGSTTTDGEIRMNTGAGNLAVYIDSNRNLGIKTSTAFGSGAGVLGIANASTNPSTNPSGGGVLYSDGGAGKWRSSGGTTTTFGPAEPYCKVCGRDFVLEWENKKTGHLIVCMWCLAEKLGEEKWITRIS